METRTQKINNGEISMNSIGKEKQLLKEIHARHEESKKDFKNRCLIVIETLVGGDIEYDDIEKLKADIYEVAHVALHTCPNEHNDWKSNVERLFGAFEKDGLI